MSEETFPIQSDDVTKRRDHTDGVCCVLFLAVCCGMAALATLGFFNGDIKRLTHGRDYHGRLCGADAGVEDKPWLYYCGALERIGDFPKRLNYRSTSCISECPNTTQARIPCVMPEYVNTTLLGGATEQNITFVSTFNVEVTQSVAYQFSYPTTPYLGKYCIPLETTNNTLFSEVINGPLKSVAQYNSAISSLLNAWPAILGAAILAAILGMGYLYVLKSYAGLLLYGSMWVGVVTVLLFGLFFLYGLFPDPFNELGWYQQISPVFVVCYGASARLVSALLGFVLLAGGACMLFATLNEDIDKSIGIICAAVECIMGPGSGFSFLLQPLIQALSATFLLAVLFLGFVLVSSVTEIDRNLMAINGVFVPEEPYAKSLMVKEVRLWYWDWAMHFYIFGAIWIFLTFISFCQFVISYAVCDWFFVKGEEEDNPEMGPLTEPMKKAIANKGKRVDGVRVRGVDKAQGTRSGYIERGPHGKVLVVPIGEKGPAGRDFIRVPSKIQIKKVHCCAMQSGILACLYYHLGTVAIAGPVCMLTSPVRMFSDMLKTFIGSGGEEDPTTTGMDDEERTPGGLAVSGMGLLSSLLDELVGRFSKNLLTDVVLRSSNFAQASSDAYDFISEAGGTIAMLHGGTGNYELIGVIIITAICSVVSRAVLTQVDVFADPEGALYVSDPAMMTLFAAFVCAMIASAFMSLFNIAADALLFVFAWSRKFHQEDLNEFCPMTLQHILGREMEEEPAMALEKHPVNRFKRFTHAATRYKETVMATINTRRGTSEQRPLLGMNLTTRR